MYRTHSHTRNEFWAHKQVEAERLERLEKWERLFNVRVFPEILINRP